jgi:hypothetical protein
MAIAIGGALSLASSAGSLLGISGSKDPGRLSSNLKAYNMAISGNVWVGTPIDSGYATPLAFLLGKSPTSKGGAGGWATTVAQEDAWQKYTQAKQIIASGSHNISNTVMGSTPMFQAPGSTTGSQLNVMGASLLPSPESASAMWLFLIVGFAAVVYFRPKGR